jgi:hypothetical protein
MSWGFYRESVSCRRGLGLGRRARSTVEEASGSGGSLPEEGEGADMWALGVSSWGHTVSVKSPGWAVGRIGGWARLIPGGLFLFS